MKRKKRAKAFSEHSALKGVVGLKRIFRGRGDNFCAYIGKRSFEEKKGRSIIFNSTKEPEGTSIGGERKESISEKGTIAAFLGKGKEKEERKISETVKKKADLAMRGNEGEKGGRAENLEGGEKE